MNFDKSIKSHCPPLVTYFSYIPRNDTYNIYVLAVLIVNAFIAIFAICSNLVIICTILKTKSLQTASNILLLGLAVSDFSVGLFSVPFFCVYKFSEYIRNLQVYCLSGIGYLSTATMLIMISFGTLTVITADRFLAVYLHLRYNVLVTVRRYIIIIVLMWVVSIIATSLRMLLFDFYSLVFAAVLFIITLLLNGYFIFYITRVIRRHTHQIHVQSTPNSSTTDMPKLKKSVNTMYCIIGAFVLCYLPFGFFLVLMAIRKDIGLISRTLFSIGATFILLNSALNPVIYCWKIKEIRNTSVRMLKGIFMKRLSTVDETSVE